MWLNKKKVNRRHTVLFVILICVILFTIIGPTRIMVSFYYLKNGNSIVVNNYKIQFPFSHWAYFGESRLAYVVAGKKVDGHVLSAEFFKNTNDIDIINVTANCDKLDKLEYTSDTLIGIKYICTRGNNETMYFQSKDQSIFIRENDFSSSSIKVEKEYEMLLKNIVPVKK